MKEQDKWKRGLPYVGNKGQKAQQIIDAMPSGGRFIDVFGGGGSISLTAADSGKWDQIIYNDRRKTVVELLEALLKDDPHIDLSKYAYMTRKNFFHWRDDMPDSIERTARLLCWSFSNNQNNFLWSEKRKDEFLATWGLFYGNTGTVFDEPFDLAKTTPQIADKYAIFRKWRREAASQNRILSNNLRLIQIERLSQLEKVQNHVFSENLLFNSLDYQELDINSDDIVYCDPPYTGTGEDYGSFDDEKFQEWLKNCPSSEIYISEYTKLPNTKLFLNLNSKTSFAGAGKRKDELLLKYVK